MKHFIITYNYFKITTTNFFGGFIMAKKITPNIREIRKRKRTLEEKLPSMIKELKEQESELRKLRAQEEIIENAEIYQGEENAGRWGATTITNITEPILNYVAVEVNEFDSSKGIVSDEDLSFLADKFKELFVVSFESIKPEYLEDYLLGMKSYGDLDRSIERNEYLMYIMELSLGKALEEVTGIRLKEVIDGFREVYWRTEEDLSNGVIGYITKLARIYRSEPLIIEEVHRRKLKTIEKLLELQRDVNSNWREILELHGREQINVPQKYIGKVWVTEKISWGHYNEDYATVERDEVMIMPLTVYVLDMKKEEVVEPIGEGKKSLVHEVPIIEKDNVIDLLELAKTYGRAVDKVVEIYSSRK